jgi:RNA polymerase sigma-70 factor (ECF subfamily)
MDFHDLYSRYARDVHRFAVYLSGDRALADDLTSEAFLRAWNSAGPISEPTVKAYLFAIVRNLYVSERRRTSRHRELHDSIPSPAPHQGDRLDQQRTLSQVLQKLQELPPVDRAALLMRTQDDMSYADIARTLRLSLSSAKVKVHRTRLKLAALFSEKVIP